MLHFIGGRRMRETLGVETSERNLTDDDGSCHVVPKQDILKESR